jgi:hypothetical protein
MTTTLHNSDFVNRMQPTKLTSSDEDFDNEEEDAVAMLAKNIKRLMKNEKFKKKFTKRLKKAPKQSKPE